MPRLLGLLAARSSALLNLSELSRASGIAHTTLRRYLALLEATFLLQPLPAWSTNVGKRFVKVVLYLGENVLPFGQNLWAVPISELWAPADQNRSIDPSSRS